VDFFYIITFSHHCFSVNDLGCLHISEDDQRKRLSAVKEHFNFSELMFLSTCNRVEFMVCTPKAIEQITLSSFLAVLYPTLSEDKHGEFANKAHLYRGESAVKHLLRVASSIESMVVGEREIITQIRKAYELCKYNSLTGDFLRLLIRHTLETTKQIYTETNIAKKPVSIVSLAYHHLKTLNIAINARVLIVGAGATNINLSRFLKKHGFTNFVVFNRSLDKAKTLAQTLNGRALSLSELSQFKDGFDVLITCTGADQPIITSSIYKSLLINEQTKKVIIDLSIPQDIDPIIEKNYNITRISMDFLQQVSKSNLQERNKEVKIVEAIVDKKTEDFKSLHSWRNIELALRDIPQQVRNIKEQATQKVYRSEIDSLDEKSKEVLEKVLCYIEKKYINMPMLIAKDTFFEQ